MSIEHTTTTGSLYLEEQRNAKAEAELPTETKLHQTGSSIYYLEQLRLARIPKEEEQLAKLKKERSIREYNRWVEEQSRLDYEKQFRVKPNDAKSNHYL